MPAFPGITQVAEKLIDWNLEYPWNLVAAGAALLLSVPSFGLDVYLWNLLRRFSSYGVRPSFSSLNLLSPGYSSMLGLLLIYALFLAPDFRYTRSGYEATFKPAYFACVVALAYCAALVWRILQVQSVRRELRKLEG